jgi:predicted TIM-barrel fold metal-dependent hydrolase
MRDAGHLVELFQQRTPNPAAQKRVLVDNPAKLYDFPN